MEPDQNRIAVIGMACRFPGADNLDEYWDNLINGRDTIKHFSDDELAKFELNYDSLRNNPDYVKARGVISNPEMFDAEFFGMTPKDAALTDPQHRVWLETAWHALENAGCNPYSYKGAIGVYAGSYVNTYLLNNILRDRNKLENYIRLRSTESFQILTGNDAAFIPTKTAYKFNLRGPAVNVQTACSTSLVAISMGCQSLLSFESDMVIAGGVCLVVPQESGYLFQEGAIPSPDGKCRPFDAEGKGTVFSNGVGVVVLKRYSDAVRDKDRIYALVRGWALNNDGNSKVSYMAPGVMGQSEVITMAQAFSEVSADQVGYIEAHGTATQLGDPVELTALKKVFSASTSRKQFCGIGSVKGNIGHTDAAAGVASFIKSCLSAYHRLIPPSINFNQPNPHFDFADSPFYVQDKLRKWDNSAPLIIGISSFGIGGTNAHVIIEEPPVAIPADSTSEWPDLLVLSARSEPSLNDRKKDLVAYVSENPGMKINDVAFTLYHGRGHMDYRSFAVAGNTDELKSSDLFTPGIKADDKLKGIAFMFSGQGAQYVSMGQGLYRSDINFKRILDECFYIYKNETGSDLKEVLFGESEKNEEKLKDTSLAQPALFIIEYALARLYLALGVKPGYLIGHSIGEYAAACISGVFDLSSALKIVIRRGLLMKGMPEGKMMAVRCNMERLKVLAGTEFEIAAENSENQCTISFRSDHSGAVNAVLQSNGIQALPLNTSHAFHSSAFNPILSSFSDYVNSFRINPAEIPIISCLTGEFITPGQSLSGDYWAKQLRNPVLFRKGIQTIISREDVLFLEVGPDTHLTGLARQNSAVTKKHRVITSLGKNDGTDEKRKIITSLGYIWANGFNPGFNVLNSGGKKIDLPPYPFQRKRYWIDHTPAISNDVLQLESELINPVNAVHIQTETSAGLKRLLSETSGYPQEDINEDLSFDKMGFDSLFLTQFALGIQRKFGIKIEFRQLVSDYPTLRVLADFIERETGQYRTDQKKGSVLNNLVRFQPEGHKDPLIILHGQSADTFIPEYLGKDRPYYGFIHPGSDGESINFRSVEEMATAYLDQLLMYKPDGPYFLGGFSFGGVLAFEMAVQLTKMGHKVPFVILFDSFAREEPFRWHKSLYRIVKSNLLVPVAMKGIKLVKSAVCESYILAGKPTPVSLRPFYIINTYARLIRSYKPGKYEGKTVLFRALENNSAMKNLGWDGCVSDLEILPLQAGHLTILKNADCVHRIQTEIMRLMDSYSGK